jgi:hypothetical protein
MKKLSLGLAALVAITSSLSSAAAAGKGYASARAACLAQAGTDEATFSARKATYAQGDLRARRDVQAVHDRQGT